MRSTLPTSRRDDAVKPALAAFGRAVGIGLAGGVAAPAVMIGRSLFYAILLLVLSSFWDVAARERLAGAAAHLPAAGLALYIGVTEWITLATPAIHLRLEDDIRSGALEAQLLRPKSYLMLRFGESFGAMLVRLVAVAAVALVLLAVSGRQGPPAGVFPWLLLTGLLGAVAGLLVLTLVGLTAFWVRRTLPVYLVVQKASFLLGGLLAPVTLYPPWLRRLGELSPFAAHLYWPAALTLDPSARTLALALASQLSWIAILTGLCLLVWRAGLAKILRQGFSA